MSNMKPDLETLLDTAAAADSFHIALHRQIVDAIKTADVQSLPLRERAKGYAHLQDAVLFLSAETGAVEPAKFPDELSALFKISAALRYSPALHEWMTQSRKTCVRGMKEDSTFTQQQWKSASPEERLDMIRLFVHDIMTAHGTDTLAFKTPNIDIDDKIKSNGAFTTHVDGGGHPGSDHIRIHFGRKLLEHDSPLPALMMGYHESVHVLTAQLAFAAHAGDISPGHPLYRDACVNLEKMKAGAIADQSLPDHYHYDCDEELAYYQQDQFLSDFSGIAPSSRRVIHAAAPSS
jgi:hypothetical protein